MADPWKTEYHLIPPNEREAIDWFDDREEAIAAAKAKGDGWKVQEVVSYLDDRETIWPEDAA
jgi:hypothetical protein